MDIPYTNAKDLGRPLPVIEVPKYVKKKEDIISWIDKQKNAKLIKILIAIMLVLMFIASMMYLGIAMYKAYLRGGVQESDKVLTFFATTSVLKTALTPILPV